MRLLFKYPTRSRPQKFQATLSRVQRMVSRHNDNQFRISIDEDDPTMNNPEMFDWILNTFPNATYAVGSSTSKVEAINTDLEGEWDIVVVLSDDMLPVRRLLDIQIVTDMQAHFPNLDGALAYNTGDRTDGLVTMPILGRAKYNEWGYIYHPSYKSLYCDNEYTDILEDEGKLQRIPMQLFRHEHNIDDELMVRNEGYFEIDDANYVARRARRAARKKE